MTAKQTFGNNARSVLLSPITAAATALSVAAGDGDLFPALSGGDWFMATLINVGGDIEIIKVSARSGDTFGTIVRAQEGTAALAFDANTFIGQRATAGTYENLQQRTDIQANTPLFCGIAGGTADALTATLASDLTALTNGMRFMVQAAAANATTTPTFNLTLGSTATGAKTIVKGSNHALVAGDIAGAEFPLDLQYDSSLNKWVLLNPATTANPAALSDPEAIPDSTPWVAQWLQFALGNQVDAITAGTPKFTTRLPACEILDVRASLKTASSSGDVVIDINESGVSILSTKLSIDAAEKTSETAATPAVISDADIADDAELTFDIDSAGTDAVGPLVSMRVRWL